MYEENITEVFIGWMLYLFSYAILRSNRDTMLNIFLYLYFHISVVPCLILYMYGATKLWMVVYQIFFLIFIKLLTNFLSMAVFKPDDYYRGDIHKDVSLSNNLIVWTFILVFVAYMIATSGLPSLSSLGFDNISDVRSEYDAPLVIGLIQNVLCKILIPIIISDTFEKKKWGKCLLAVLIQVYVYGITGFKTFILIPVLIIAVKQIKIKNFKKLIMIGMFLGFSAVLVLFYITNSVMLAAVVFNRLAFLPAIIKEAYFDFFSKNEFVYFSQSSIASILGIESNYSQDIVYLIGDIYFDSPDMWTNTGFLSDGYSNLGILGGFIVSAILSVELALLNKCVRNPAKNYVTVVFLLFFIALNDGAIISVSISGVFLPAILLVYFTRVGENR